MKALKIIYGLGIGYLLYQTVSFLLALIVSSADHSSGIQNVSFALFFICGLAASTLGLLFMEKLRIFSLGLLVGGLLLIMNQSGISTSLFRTFPFSDNDFYGYGGEYFGIPLWGRFLSLLVALGVLGFVGYMKFFQNKNYSESSTQEDETEGGPTMTAIKVIYGLGIGLMLIALVGFGIAAFYQPPDYGGWGNYAINVSIITGIYGLALALAGLLLTSRLNTIKIGLLFGGLLTLIAETIFLGITVSLGGAFAAAFIVLVILVAAGYYSLVMRKEAKG